MKNVLFFLMAFLFECQIVAQEVIIRGSVADAADGSPLIGANVLVKGTSVGTITDVEGKFSLKVPKGTSKLTFSCVGYQEQEVALKANQTMLDVSMREDSELLDEVVVIGYGGAKKSDLTGAVSVLESSDLLDANPLSVSQGLQGKIAGVNVTQTDGAPGAGMNILIRGINSGSSDISSDSFLKRKTAEQIVYLNCDQQMYSYEQQFSISCLGSLYPQMHS